jgi:glycyl-tRNA synthetase
MDGGRYVVAEVREPGRPAGEVLAEALPGLVASLRFDTSMRWNASGVAFSRPIRWLLALHGESIVPFAYAGSSSGNRTRLMRFAAEETADIRSANDYRGTLERAGIMLDPEARRGAIRQQIEKLAAGVGGAIPDADDLLSEVANLVEQPTALAGAFDPAFLTLPREVLVAVMRKHQRYFPVEQGGKLLPYFIAVRNGGSQHLDSVTRGNEHVLRARFSDAAYFVRRDREQPLEAFLPRLATMTFQERLGSVLDKVGRIERLTALLARDLELDAAASKTAARAAHLSKADLATKMVVEMTSLQGEVGRQYARADGEPEAVAEAIFEHYLPRHAGDRTAAGLPGLVVGLADRLDSLIGLFAAGLQPTGARDPFGLRRAAIGLVQNLVESGVRFDLRRGLRQAAEGLPIPAAEPAELECLAFIAGRQSALLLADGHRHDVVEAVLAAQAHDPAGGGRGGGSGTMGGGRRLGRHAPVVRPLRSYHPQPAFAGPGPEGSGTDRAGREGSGGCAANGGGQATRSWLGGRLPGSLPAHGPGRQQVLRGCDGHGRRRRRACQPIGAPATHRGAGRRRC